MRDRENESDVPAPIRNGSEAPTNNGRWVASYKPSFGEGDGGIDGEVKKIWAMLRRRRLTLAVSTIIIGAVVAGGFWILPNRFRSTVTILVETPGQTESTGLTILERVWQGANVETEVHLMTSSSVVMPIVDEFELNAKLIDANDDDRRPQELFSQFSVEPDAPGGDYSLALGTDGEFTVRAADTDSLLLSAGQGELVFFEGITLEFPTGSGAESIAEAELSVLSLPEAVAETRGRIEAARVGLESNLISLDCISEFQEEAQQLCAALSESYLRLRTDLQRTEATTTATFLAQRLGDVTDRMRASENALERFTERNQIVALETRADQEVLQLASVKAERDGLDAERQALTELLSEIDADGSTRAYRDLASFPSFLQNQTVRDMLGALLTLDSEYSTLAVRRTEENAELAALAARISAIEQQLYRFANGHQRALSAQIASLDSTLDEAGERIALIPAQQLELVRLERERELVSDLYRLLQTRLQEAQVAEAVTLPDIRIVDQASFPIESEGTGMLIGLATALVLGLGFGLLVAFYREAVDTRIRGREQVQLETGLPVLSVIPTFDKPPNPRPSLEPGSKEIALRESFVNLATDLEFAWSRLDKESLGSLAVVSSTRGEGKSFVAGYLAMTAAEDRRRILLVDGDLRAGGVTRLYGLRSAPPGVSQVLTGEATLEDAVAGDGSYYHGAGANGLLSVLPTGGFDPRAARLLGGRPFRELLRKAEGHGYLTIVDTPPLTMLSDAVAVASMVDAVIVVVRAGLTDRTALDLSLERLSRAGAQVVGVVLNGVELPREHYTSYDYTRT